MILTGTPEGVGPLHSGDELEVGFNGLAPVSYTHLDVYKRQALSGCVSVPDAIKGTSPTPQQDLVRVMNAPQLRCV